MGDTLATIKMSLPVRGGGRREVDFTINPRGLTEIDSWLFYPNIRVLKESDDDALNDLVTLASTQLTVPMDAHVAFDMMKMKVDSKEIIERTAPSLDNENIYHYDVAVTFTDEYEKWWNQTATDSERTNIAVAATLLVQRQIESAINIACDMLIATYRVRRGAKPTLMFHYLRDAVKDLPLDEPEDLLNPKNFEAVFEGDRWKRWFRQMERMHTRNAIGLGFMPGRYIHRRLDEVIDQLSDEKQINVIRKMRESVSSDVNLFRIFPSNYPYGSSERRATKAGRKAVMRGIAAFERCFGAKGRDRVLRFLRGEEVTIPGRLFDYRVLKSYPAWQHSIQPDTTHIPFMLGVYDKAGQRLASGCVYFEGAPLVDQLLALSLFVRTEDDERTLLSQMNLSRLTPSFMENALIRSIKNDETPDYQPERRVRRMNTLARRMMKKRGPMDRTKRKMMGIAERMIMERCAIPPQMFTFYAVPPITMRDIVNGKWYDNDAKDIITHQMINFFDLVRTDIETLVVTA